MEQFTYTNIFDTKGIEYLVVIGFLLLLIPFWRWLSKPVESRAEAAGVARALTAALLRIPRGLFYGPNHTWAHLNKSGLATVGMDDLLLHLTGGVEVRFLKAQEEQIRKGDPLASIGQEGKQLVIHSPISGRIIESHESLQNDPEGLVEDPYRSWLYQIEPESWQDETGGYLMGEKAEAWAGSELERFREFLSSVSFSGTPDGQPVLQAGGELIDQPLKIMDPEVWEQFQEMFLGMKE